MKVTNIFKSIIDIDSRYLILEGNEGAGKFYSSCQKVVIKSNSDYSRTAIVCNDIRYASAILREILPGNSYGFNMTLSQFQLRNGSVIDILNYYNILDVVVTRYDNYVIRDANQIDYRQFRNLHGRLSPKGQIILTTDDINPIHWLGKLRDNFECTVVGVKNSIDECTEIPDIKISELMTPIVEDKTFVEKMNKRGEFILKLNNVK